MADLQMAEQKLHWGPEQPARCQIHVLFVLRHGRHLHRRRARPHVGRQQRLGGGAILGRQPCPELVEARLLVRCALAREVRDQVAGQPAHAGVCAAAAVAIEGGGGGLLDAGCSCRQLLYQLVEGGLRARLKGAQGEGRDLSV